MSASPSRIGVSSLPDLARVVLSVAVDLNRNVVTVLEGVAVTGLDSSADPDVEGQPDDGRASTMGDRRGGVTRTVIDDQHREAGIRGADLLNHVGDGMRLVEGGDNRNAANGIESRIRGTRRLGRQEPRHRSMSLAARRRPFTASRARS